MNFYFQISYQQKNDEDSEKYNHSSTRNQVKKNDSSLKSQSKRHIKKRDHKSLRWSHQQHIQYIKFLVKQKFLFDLPLIQKRKIAIHNLMSKSIKTKNSLQCRSHHQKMLLKYKNIQNIINHFLYLSQNENDNINQVKQEKNIIQLQELSISSIIGFNNKDLIYFQDLLDYPEMLIDYSQQNLFQKQFSNESDIY